MDSLDKQLIIISGYPKSGNTWLTRLIGDVLNSPTGGSHPSEDSKEIATEGLDRPGNYIVRKGHYRLDFGIDYVIDNGCCVPEPHKLLINYVTDERLIFIVRDPRDIIASACHHWRNKTKPDIINLVCKGGLAKLPAWDEYIRQWQQVDNVYWTSYEALSLNPLNELQYILNGLDYDKARLIPAITRQSFENRKRQIAKEGDSLYLGKDYNLRFMRKGHPGDYVNSLTRQEIIKINKLLGSIMKEFDYL